MAQTATYRALIVDELEELLPLIKERPEGILPQMFCGPGHEGDFTGNPGQGREGKVWQFITDQPELMEECLRIDPAVAAFQRLA